MRTAASTVICVSGKLTFSILFQSKRKRTTGTKAHPITPFPLSKQPAMKILQRSIVLLTLSVLAGAYADPSSSWTHRHLQATAPLKTLLLNLGSYLKLGLHWYLEGQDSTKLSSTSGLDFIFAVESPIRINCGGTAVTDVQGTEWMADKYYIDGSWGASSALADGGSDFILRQSYRTEVSSHLQYDLPLTRNAVGETYLVNLYFGDTVNYPLDFSVSIGGSVAHTPTDLQVAAGAPEDPSAPFTAVQYTFDSPGGLLSIRFDPGASDRVWVSAIEVLAVSITKAPVPAPVASPTRASVPTAIATRPPTTQVKEPLGFEPILINSGGVEYTDVNNKTWAADQYFDGGSTYADGSVPVEGTQDDFLYQTERVGTFTYSIPLPLGSYSVSLHFAELFFEEPGQRTFHVVAEDEPIFTDLDVVAYAGGNFIASTMEFVHVVSDGSLDLSFLQTNPANDNPKVSAIQIDLVEPHLAHAVSGGPYRVVDTDGSESETVLVDGSFSHTHAVDQELVHFIWKSDSKILGRGEFAEFTLSVGLHEISLTVIDSAGNTHTEDSTITVLPSDFPDLASISPDQGPVDGGMMVVLKGSGFGTNVDNLSVKFGVTELDADQISLVDENTIEVIAPSVLIGAPAPVSVVSKYIASVPIKFNRELLTEVPDATVAAFGPDQRLYIGTNSGMIIRLEFEPGTFNVLSRVESMVTQWRSILGIAFDPMQTADDPNLYVYFSNSFFFHGDFLSTSGHSVNGKISRASGENLDVVEDIIVGIPISDHDHGMNGIEFGDRGELYMQVGGNTNAGIPGKLTGNQKQKESVLSAATLIADLSKPQFDGVVTYSALDDGDITSGDVFVFASGNRNPFSITLHSNGYLYGTDNGPNIDYGDVSTGCGSQGPEVEEEDKINLLERGNYYGHPNRKRGEIDPRQCTWHSQTEPSTDEFTAPLMIVPSSTCGVIEFQSNHFGGQMKGNLIVAKFMGGLSRIILSPNGRSVVPQSVPPIPLNDANGLDVIQAPSGELIEVSLADNSIFVHEPIEDNTDEMTLLSVFPRRGSFRGASTLTLYGNNFGTGRPTVTVGGASCPVTNNAGIYLECTLPAGRGNSDVVVSVGGQTSTLVDGYRFIPGTSSTSSA